MSSREDLHQLVEQLEAGDLGAAEAALRSLVQRSAEPAPRHGGGSGSPAA